MPVGGWAEMGGIGKSAQFLHLRVSHMGGTWAEMGGERFSIVLRRAKCYLMRARRCERLPAFTERMTQAGTLYSRLVPACLFLSTETGKWR